MRNQSLLSIGLLSFSLVFLQSSNRFMEKTYAQAGGFNRVTERGRLFPGSNLSYGSFGVPSIHAWSEDRWSIAVRHGQMGSVSALGSGVLWFENSGATVGFYAPASGISFGDPSAARGLNQRPAMLASNGLAQSGYSILPSAGTPFIFGRPAAGSTSIIQYEYLSTNGGATFFPALVRQNHPYATAVVDCNGSTYGFNDLGLGLDHEISYRCGTVGFRGHGNTPNLNGIFVKTPSVTGITTIADNNTFNPLLASPGNFVFSNSNLQERLPVAHGSGAAWSYNGPTKAESGVLSRVPGGPIAIVSKGLGHYGRVASRSSRQLFYEVDPAPGAATQIWTNLVGKEFLCVDRLMITDRAVIDLAMGSEAAVEYSLGTSAFNKSGGTLAFYAHGFGYHDEHGLYTMNLPVAIDFAGRFGGDRVTGSGLQPQYFSIAGGGSTGEPPDLSGYVLLTAHDSTGQPLPVGQDYANALGVIGAGTGEPFLMNSSNGISEGLSITCDQKMVIDTVILTQLDVGESYSILVNGIQVHSGAFEGNGETRMMEGLQAIELDGLVIRAGSSFTIEHGGVGDGFGLSSIAFKRKPDKPIRSSHVHHSAFSGPSGPLDTVKHLAVEGEGPQVLTYNNLINSAQGINGIAFDIEGLGNLANINAADFIFQMSPQGVFDEGSNPPSGWVNAPLPTSITVSPGPWYRILIKWDDLQIWNRWLRVTVLNTENTGLDSPEVFYLGHLIGETTSADNNVYTVSMSDIPAIRSSVGQMTEASSITDIDKNGTVNFSDIMSMRVHVGTQLKNVTIP